MTDPEFEAACARFCFTPKGRPFTPKSLSDFTGIAVATINSYRQTGTGPRYFVPRGSRLVFYAERDVIEWLAEGERSNTSQTAAA